MYIHVIVVRKELKVDPNLESDLTALCKIVTIRGKYLDLVSINLKAIFSLLKYHNIDYTTIFLD